MRKRFTTALMVLALLYALTLTALAAGPNGTLSVQLYSWSQHTYTPASAEVVKLTLNGEALEGDVPAMIRDGRTLVPVRLVGEALQAQVLWVQQTGQVILTGGEDVIVLTLDSATALVNGVPTPLPDGVPAQVISYGGADRTMIPLRFVSETLGAQVEWDQTTYTARLTADLPETAPEPPEEEPETPAQEPEIPDGVTRITGMTWKDGTLTIAADQAPSCKVTDLGDRVAIDFLNAALGEDFSSCAVDGPYLSGVRYAQHGADFYPGSDCTVRIVLDLAAGAAAAGNLTVTATAAENRPDYQGIYTYYHPSSNRGTRLAQAIQTPLCQITGAVDRGIKDADFVVLRETEMCAVLVETGFMTNHEELMNLNEDSYQQLVAQGIARGIIDYLNAEAQAAA